MTKNELLAQELYKISISSKQYNRSNLRWCHKRHSLIRTLSAMQLLVQYIGMNHITDNQIELLRSSLEYALDTPYLDFASRLKQTQATSNYSITHMELLTEMSGILSLCITELTKKQQGKYETIHRYIWGFHNFPRAFVSESDSSYITPAVAREYANSYFKCD